MESIPPPSAADHKINRLQIARILCSESLLAGIKVNIDGRLRAMSISWDDYWAPCRQRLAAGAIRQLADLRSVWRAYINSGFSIRLAIPYCQVYFSLLRSALDSPLDQIVGEQFLKAILGFECAAARWPDQSDTSFAVTSNIRNPVYLLAKLREPKAYVDPKFLPQISVFDPMQQEDERGTLFYHYRQIVIDKKREISLLVYPTTEVSSRLDSFACIQNLSLGLTHRKDPRSRRRSEIIAANSIGPFFSKCPVSEGLDRTDEIKIADLGGGSGEVLRGICERLLEERVLVSADKKFSWTVVDVKFRNHGRHAKNHRFRRNLSAMRWEQADYITWVNRQPILPGRNSFHVILLCRLLNNLSNFSIGWIDDWYQVKKLTLAKLTYREWQQGSYLPQICLKHEGGSSRSLVASNARVELLRGSSFCQASASDYFRGLYRIQHGALPSDVDSHAIFFPIRRFNNSSLQLPSGKSIVHKLISLGQLLVIEDVDCRARELRNHLEEHGLRHIAASDVTDRNQMRSSRLLCACSRADEHCLPGTRIW